MAFLQALYIMAFSPEKLDQQSLMGTSRTAADRLAGKNPLFAWKIGMIAE